MRIIRSRSETQYGAGAVAAGVDGWKAGDMGMDMSNAQLGG